MRKIFVDCSYLVTHTELNTGIQRVVRKIIENLEKIAKDSGEFKVVLVDISYGNFNRVTIEDISLKGINIFSKIERKILKKLKSLDLMASDGELDISPQDTLLLLDSTWYLDIWKTVEEFKRRGAKVVAVIYDLIPITHSQFCDDFLVKVFKDWFRDSILYVDGYIAISNTIKEDLFKFLKSNFSNCLKSKELDYFLLGNDFVYKDNKNLIVRNELKELFKRPTYLIVSTIEPRKTINIF